MMSDHQEQLRLWLSSAETVAVELESTSTLHCSSTRHCLSLISPIPSEILALLHDFSNLTSLRWEFSSLSKNTLTSTPHRSSPSGVSVKIELEDGASNNNNILKRVLERLQSHRLLLAPMDSVFLNRLHRYHNETYAHLPMDGTAVTAEAMSSFLPTCGLWTGATPDTWSSFLQGTAPSMANAQRSLWMDFSKQCTPDSGCVVVLKKGIQYGRRWKGSSLSLKDVLPSDNRVVKCPWAKRKIVQVARPKSVSATISTDQVDSDETDTMLITSHELHSSLSEPFVQVEESSWIENSYGRIDRTIHRSNGMAHTGILETTIANDDVYEAHISLYDIVPSYIRPSSIEFSSEAERFYHSLPDSSILLQHEFTLPPQSSARVAVAYDPMLLPFEHFPPDPNRGMEVPPSWAVWNATDTLYSQSLLLLPPVPDMSMPFNVISLSCTLYAFVIGSIVNVLVRRAEDKIYYQLHPDKKPKTGKDKLKEKLQKLKEKLTGKKKQAEPVNAEEDEEPVEEDWAPEANLHKEDDNSDVPYLLTQTQRQVLARKALPASTKGRSWKRLYSLERDGDSFETFLKKVQKDDSTLLVVKTMEGHVFGGFADHVWERHESYFGAGQAFLFSVKEDDETNISVYKWTGANGMVQHVDGDKRRLVMGGGGSGFGLCVEDNFRQGSTSKCETFDNEALCPHESFQVVSFEAYGFVRGSF